MDRTGMNKNEPSTYEEEDVWSATVKYRDKPDLTFPVSRSETVLAFESIE